MHGIHGNKSLNFDKTSAWPPCAFIHLDVFANKGSDFHQIRLFELKQDSGTISSASTKVHSKFKLHSDNLFLVLSNLIFEPKTFDETASGVHVQGRD